MRSFQERISEFEKRGLQVVAISNDPPEVNGPHRKKLGLSFPMLSDTQAEVIRQYDLLHEGGGQEGEDISRPAEFLVDASGTVRWVNLTQSAMVRARPAQVLEAWDELNP